MAQLLIRDVPDHVIAAIDGRAARLGLSRSEFLRRWLAQEATTAAGPVTVEDLREFARDPCLTSKAGALGSDVSG